MATVTTPRPSFNYAESNRRVRHPLQRLRSHIRFYVGVEGLAVLALFLALWFWIGLLMDYGFFKVFGIDWVQELSQRYVIDAHLPIPGIPIHWVQEVPHPGRWGVLLALVAGVLALVVLKVVRRLFREFRDPALALVLERRFPDLLGDRLITAVELANPELAERYGYSPVMIEQTIRDAAERVDRLPINEVFDWKRLRRLGLTIAGLTLGLYLLVGGAYCAINRTADIGGYSGRFSDVAVIWFERNVLFDDTIWPRRAHLELLDFPDDEIRIGRDAAAPTLRVRALKWVIADLNRHKAPEGWRALAWTDLNDDLLGAPVPQDKVPPQWRDWTLDQIELQLDKADEVNRLAADAVLELRGVFEKLHERAALSKMSRRLRELMIPENVEVYYKGKTTRTEQTMPPGVNREYSGTVSNLRETLRFTVRGEDYYTPSKQIVVVPPPSLIELTVDEFQPAYLYHRVPLDGTAADLKGKKQQFLNRPISLTGEKSSIQVPTGTDLVLTARIDKPLLIGDGVRARMGHKLNFEMRGGNPQASVGEAMRGGIELTGPSAEEVKELIKAGLIDPTLTLEQLRDRLRNGGLELKLPIEQPDEHVFRTRFSNITTIKDLVFEFTDTDKVHGLRHVEIKPSHDLPPEVEVQVEVIRKVNQAYMATAKALIPFSGKIRDDRGLAGVEYAYTVEKVESKGAIATVLGLAARVLTSGTGDIDQRLAAVVQLQMLARLAPGDDSARKADRVEKVSLASFERVLREQAKKAVTLGRLPQLLEQPPTDPLLKDFDLDPELEFFGVERLGIKSAEDNPVPPQYRLRLWVVATDNNIETGPRTGASKEKFTFLIVTENELLAEIAKEEDALHAKFEDAVNRLKDAKIKLDKVVQELPGLKPDEFSPMARRTEELVEAVGKSWDSTREIYGDYRRILKELKANQVQPGMISKVNDKICEPLDGAINGEFVQSDESLRDFLKKLDDKNGDSKAADVAKQRLQALIDRLLLVLDAMGELMDLNKLIAQARLIETREREEYQELKKLLEKKTGGLLDDLDKEPKPKDKK